MSNSPIYDRFDSDIFITPSRKPTQHHCNADRKHNFHTAIEQNNLGPICRKLFAEEGAFARSYVPGVNAKLLR